MFGVDPMNMGHPELSNEWRQFWLNALTSFVNELVKTAHKNGKRILATVFPFPD